MATLERALLPYFSKLSNAPLGNAYTRGLKLGLPGVALKFFDDHGQFANAKTDTTLFHSALVLRAFAMPRRNMTTTPLKQLQVAGTVVIADTADFASKLIRCVNSRGLSTDRFRNFSIRCLRRHDESVALV